MLRNLSTIPGTAACHPVVPPKPPLSTKGSAPTSQQLAKQLTAEMTTQPGYPILAECPSDKKNYLAAVSNPIGELWDIISKKEYMSAVNECHHIDDLCGRPDWLDHYMDNEILHDGVLLFLVEQQIKGYACGHAQSL